MLRIPHGSNFWNPWRTQEILSYSPAGWSWLPGYRQWRDQARLLSSHSAPVHLMGLSSYLGEHQEGKSRWRSWQWVREKGCESVTDPGPRESGKELSWAELAVVTRLADVGSALDKPGLRQGTWLCADQHSACETRPIIFAEICTTLKTQGSARAALCLSVHALRWI